MRVARYCWNASIQSFLVCPSGAERNREDFMLVVALFCDAHCTIYMRKDRKISRRAMRRRSKRDMTTTPVPRRCCQFCASFYFHRFYELNYIVHFMSNNLEIIPLGMLAFCVRPELTLRDCDDSCELCIFFAQQRGCLVCVFFVCVVVATIYDLPVCVNPEQTYSNTII